MGKKAPRKIMNPAEPLPIPNHKIAMGIQANGGMGRIISTNGSTIPRNLFEMPMKTPRGIAIKAAALNPRKTR
jgi:hypothetical protein